jgi:probable F420-dependent oxidoreductase
VLAAVAERTKAIRLGTGVLVLPIREPVVLTKQLTTLDQLSGGRLTLGVGTGAYREEFEAVRPGMRAARRAAIMDEAVDAIRLLLTERRASYAGTFVEFSEVELFPKAAQDPLPIYFGGNSPAVWKRVAERGQGWIAGSIPIDRVEAGHREIIRLAAAADRDPRDIDVAPQFVCCMGSTRKAAVDRFRASRFYQHLLTLGGSTLRGERLDALERVNLVGSPQELVERIADMERRGVTHLAATVFVSETPAEMREDMQRFADDVMAKLR